MKKIKRSIYLLDELEINESFKFIGENENIYINMGYDPEWKLWAYYDPIRFAIKYSDNDYVATFKVINTEENA